jgi:hypothetical protein
LTSSFLICIPFISFSWFFLSCFFTFHLFIIILLLYWGYNVTFTNVLTIQHSQIHPLHHSPLPLTPHYCNSFNRSHFCIFILENIFSLYSLFYTLFLYPPPSHWYQLHRQDLF